MIWAILAEKNEDKVNVNEDESLADLQTLIKYSFLLNFLHESLMNLIMFHKIMKIALYYIFLHCITLKWHSSRAVIIREI